MRKSALVLSALFLSVALLALSFPEACDTGCLNNPLEGDNVLNLYGEDPYTLDPAMAGDSISINYIMQIFSGLVMLDDDLVPAADIASGWQISDDNLVYTFYLRKNVYFQDGNQVTAQDFKYSWERACAPSLASQTAALYLGDIMGVDAVLSGATDTISGLTVVDDYTLQVILEKPVNYFLEKLSYPVAFVVQEDNVIEGNSWWTNPDGTGPFKLRDWQQGSELVLERNYEYYGDTALLDFVVYKILSGTEFDMYETGEIDVCNVDMNYFYKATDMQGEFYDLLSIILN
jgi:ABC-type oligopeptide transport system substrate-binding subunit